jgi:deazaflavin-dependent oxidoreductase (nitroreductase family)
VRYTFHNRVMNPVVSAVLRSPLHALFSRTNALVTVRGRRTGRPVAVPLRYAEDGDGLWIHAATPHHKTWWRNLEGGARVTVRLRGREVEARAEAIRGDTTRVAEGMWAYYRRFPALAKSMGLSWDPSSVDRAAARAVMVRVELLAEAAVARVPASVSGAPADSLV